MKAIKLFFILVVVFMSIFVAYPRPSFSIEKLPITYYVSPPANAITDIAPCYSHKDKTNPLNKIIGYEYRSATGSFGIAETESELRAIIEAHKNSFIKITLKKHFIKPTTKEEIHRRGKKKVDWRNPDRTPFPTFVDFDGPLDLRGWIPGGIGVGHPHLPRNYPLVWETFIYEITSYSHTPITIVPYVFVGATSRRDESCRYKFQKYVPEDKGWRRIEDPLHYGETRTFALSFIMADIESPAKIEFPWEGFTWYSHPNNPPN